MKNNELQCKVCKREFKSIKALGAHIPAGHKIKVKIYYDKYLKTEGEDICNHPDCNNLANYEGIVYGYNKHCSYKCSNTNPGTVKERSKTLKKTHKDDPSIGRRISKSSKQYYVDNPEKRLEAGKRGEKNWKNPKLRKQIIESLKITGNTPEFKESQRQKMLVIAEDPEWLRRVSEGTKIGQAKNPNFKQIRREYMNNGGAAHCNKFITNPSRPQVELFQLLQELYPSAIMNHQCLNFSIDMVIPEHNIAIEYDGSYWHQDSEADQLRQNKIEKEGWNFLRYVDRVPSTYELRTDIQKIMN